MSDCMLTDDDKKWLDVRLKEMETKLLKIFRIEMQLMEIELEKRLVGKKHT